MMKCFWSTSQFRPKRASEFNQSSAEARQAEGLLSGTDLAFGHHDMPNCEKSPRKIMEGEWGGSRIKTCVASVPGDDCSVCWEQWNSRNPNALNDTNHLVRKKQTNPKTHGAVWLCVEGISSWIKHNQRWPQSSSKNDGLSGGGPCVRPGLATVGTLSQTDPACPNLCADAESFDSSVKGSRAQVGALPFIKRCVLLVCSWLNILKTFLWICLRVFERFTLRAGVCRGKFLVGLVAFSRQTSRWLWSAFCGCSVTVFWRPFCCLFCWLSGLLWSI